MEVVDSGVVGHGAQRGAGHVRETGGDGVVAWDSQPQGAQLEVVALGVGDGVSGLTSTFGVGRELEWERCVKNVGDWVRT